MDERPIAARGTGRGSRRRFPVLLLGAVMGAGCGGTVPTFTYYPPEEHVVATVVRVEDPVEVVWNRLLQRLPRQGLVVDKADRDTGTIAAVFTAEAAHEYADCGAVATGAGKKETLARTASKPGRLYTSRRETFLQSTVYITVEKDREGTLVSLKPYYRVAVQNALIRSKESAVDERLFRRDRSLTFLTNTPNEVNWGTDEDPLIVNCCSTGKLEALVLGLVEPAP
jgi:hypothetical protein